MKVENLEFFRKEVYATLRRMKVEDISNTWKVICELSMELEKENLEKVMMEQLRDLLGENTNEIVEVVCSHLGVRRHYESDQDVEKYDIESNKSPVVLSGQLGYKLSSLGIRHGKSLKKIRSKLIKERKLKWSDLATCTQGQSAKKLNMPCADLMGNGVCMNVDTCRFSHKHGAVIKSKVTKFTSSYNTPKDKVDFRTCILPEQSGYYDRMNILPGAMNDDIISISSTENESHVDLRSPPCIYEPPTMLDSPLWYQEMGLVEEISDSDCSSPKRRHKVYRHRSLLLSNIPKLLNRIGVINKYFRKFGALRNIEVNFKGDSTKALIEFRLSKDMLTANKCVEAVMGNRFIRTQPYRIKNCKKKARRKGKRRSCSSSRRNRRKSHSTSLKSKCKSRSSSLRSRSSKHKKHVSRSKSCNSHCCKDFGPKLEHIQRSSSGSTIRNESSSEKSDCYYRRRAPRTRETEESLENVNKGGEIDCFGIKHGVLNVIPKSVKSVVINCKKEVLMEVDSQMTEEVNVERHNVDDVVACDTHIDYQLQIEREETEKIPCSTQEVRRVVDHSFEDEDLKLEKALNDSDVDSVHSDDSLSRMKRQVVMSSRRKQLQEDNWRNNLKKKVARTTSSLNYYKSILETLIIEYRRNDKPGKARIIPKIKETHAKYMEIKMLHSNLTKSMDAEKLRKQDPVEGQISNLGSSIEVKLSMSPPRLQESCNVYIEVPSNIVLDPLQIQGHLGANLKIDNMEKLQSPNKGSCYVIRLQSPSTAATALQLLSTNNPMKWHIGMKPPQSVPQG